jgi:hypothetical protein
MWVILATWEVEGEDQEDRGSKPGWVNSSWDYLENTQITKGLAERHKW